MRCFHPSSNCSENLSMTPLRTNSFSRSWLDAVESVLRAEAKFSSREAKLGAALYGDIDVALWQVGATSALTKLLDAPRVRLARE